MPKQWIGLAIRTITVAGSDMPKTKNLILYRRIFKEYSTGVVAVQRRICAVSNQDDAVWVLNGGLGDTIVRDGLYQLYKVFSVVTRQLVAEIVVEDGKVQSLTDFTDD